MIWMFMQSTVMDYPGDVSQDTIGLGVYDFAAARMFLRRRRVALRRA